VPSGYCPVDERLDTWVEAGNVAAACQNTDSHGSLLHAVTRGMP
jgi:hypothetical protein